MRTIAGIGEPLPKSIEDMLDKFDKLNSKMTPKDKKIIEDSEAQGIPIFVLTAKDKKSVKAIKAYGLACIPECSIRHIDGIQERLNEFRQWQKANPDKVKLPD